VITVSKQVYEALRDGAQQYNGIGAGSFVDRHGDPLCKGGLLGARWGMMSPLNRDSYRCGLRSDVNDDIVVRINLRKGKFGHDVYDRVSFEDYVAEGNIVCAEL